ncbi:MAG: FIST C-terminal domain-containing protein [Oscillatoriales cyanobacterium C42_A2020_001]|nr:FIST C-terminal domain-containing protein [Leptolyngbyaceae cyanobacterium C42_A2020_001]
MAAPLDDPMHWVSALSTRPSLEAAIAEVVERTQVALQSSATLGFIFISSAFTSEYPRLMPLLQEKLPHVPIIGCGGAGVVGMGNYNRVREIEGESALALTLAHLPGVQVHPFYLSPESLPDLDSSPNAWVDLVGVSPTEQPQFVLLAEPAFGKVNDLLQGLDFAYAGSTKVGGLASGGFGSNGGALFWNYRLYREGAVGIALTGNIVLEAIVAQGCRPIGQPFLVSEGERNIMLALEAQGDSATNSFGRGAVVSQKGTPLEMLQDLIQNLSEEDRMLAQHSLFVGVAQSEFKQTLEQGDFLIRQLIGVDPRVGAIAIGDRIRPGQRIQFHLRDAKASAEDLETMLQRYQTRTPNVGSKAIGALMFSCTGRGEGLYGQPDFDSKLFTEYLPGIPVSGFFCNGEIGPVGGSTFLHGFTSVFGIFRQR